MKLQEINVKMKTESSKKSQSGTMDDGVKDKASYFERKYPFSIISNEKTGGKVRLAIANILLQEVFEDVKQAKKYINDKPWDLIIEVIAAYHMFSKRVEEDQNGHK